MKRKLKRLKTKLAKKIENLKEFLKAQKFYFKKAMVSSRESIKLILLTLMTAGFCAMAAMTAESFHRSFIDDIVGVNSVLIRSPASSEIQGSGTGFQVISPSGKHFTLTNAHICELQKDGIVMVEDKLNSGRLLPKRVIEVYTKNDLCLVEPLEGYPGLKVAETVEIGQHVWELGYPLGQQLNISDGRIKGYSDVMIQLEGILPSDCKGDGKKLVKTNFLFEFEMEVCVVVRRALMTDVLTYPGNSGSPVVNTLGRVIGVMFATDNITNWGSAVPLKDIKDFLKPY